MGTSSRAWGTSGISNASFAALSAAVLLAVELCLTHWFYLYLPWVLPFVLLALFLPRESVAPRAEP